MNKKPSPPGGHKARIVKQMRALGRTYGLRRVFADFCEVSAIAFSNAVDIAQREAREARYLFLIKQYKELEERQTFPKMCADLALALEETREDVLGAIAGELEILNKDSGQFFTPYTISLFMAKMTLGGDDGKMIKKVVADHGFFTAAEPACGAGGMVIALSEVCLEVGINYQQHLHVTAVDIDPLCVHMTYLQGSLLRIPMIVYRGNSLSDSYTEAWYTPAHIVGGWSYKLCQHGIDKADATWWTGHSPAQRINLAKAAGLPVRQAMGRKPPREVLAQRNADTQAQAAE